MMKNLSFPESLWYRPTSVGLYELRNPHASIWRAARPEICRIDQHAGLNLARYPMLFVHGMNFRSPAEVFTDYLLPFERQARVFFKRERQDFQILFIHWDSHIFGAGTQKLVDRIGVGWGETLVKLASVPFVNSFICQLEKRARESATLVRPLLHEWLTTADAPRPWLITHSLGAYLWSHIVSTLVHDGSVSCARFGNWWNLQAAVMPHAYIKGGEFAEVEAIYRGGDDSRMTLWYSRRDFILATFYRLAKRAAAAGQIGMWGATRICHRDVTETAWEAHGLQMLRRPAGNFFERVGQLIYQDARFTNPAI